MVLVTGDGVEKACVSSLGQPLYCIDASGKLPLMCFENNPFIRPMSAAQTKLVRLTKCGRTSTTDVDDDDDDDE